MLRRLSRIFGYIRIGGPAAGLAVLGSVFSQGHKLASVSAEGIVIPFHIRVRTSDYLCYQQVFVEREYECTADWQPKTVVDAGANIGLASIFFANKFPNARIIAIEPESQNFSLMEKNCGEYPNIELVLAALWSEEADLEVCDIGNGHWGFVTRALDNSTRVVSSTVRGLSMQNLLDELGIDYVDILKVDIEGSEKEVFAGQTDWLERVGVLIIETHDWIKPGCEQAVLQATSHFDHRWKEGENNVFARAGACLSPPMR